MNPVERPGSFEAADYVGVLRRRWLIVLALTIVGVAGAFAYTVVAPKTYTGTANVNVTPTGADQANDVANSRTNSGTVNLDTEAQVVMSTTVAAAAGKILHTSLTPYALTQDISVTVPPNSSILTIACNWSTAAGSAACANAFATAYLQYRNASSVTQINSEVSTLNSKVTGLQQQAAALNTKISSLPSNSSQRLTAETDLTSVQDELHTLSNEIGSLTELNTKNTGGTIITAALPPGKPTTPKKALVLPSGLVAGLLLGLIGAFLWDRRDKRIHQGKDVERLLDMPVLVSLPRKAFSQQVSLASPRSRTGQAFTEFANAVAASLGEGNHVVLVAGTTPGAGGSVIAANLAATLARTHSESVLVCANTQDGVAPEMLGVKDGLGLAEVLAGKATVRDVARAPAGMPGLWVITPGADPSLTVYNMQHEKIRALTSQLRRDARYVVVDALATDAGADTFAFAEFADAAVVTVEIPRTTRPAASECLRRLRQFRTPVLGAAVLSAISPRAAVRPPRPVQPRLEAGHDEPRPDATVAHRKEELSALASTSAAPDSGRDRRLRSRDGDTDPASRVPGS